MKLESHPFAGLWTPLVTPFTAELTLDERSLAGLADRLLADGVAGLVALGTTGEPATLEPQERRRVLELCGRACESAGRPLIAGAGTNCTRSTIEEIALVTENAEVAAVLVVVPYYTRPSPAAVVEHFGLVADASPVPVIVYNIPYRTGRGLDASALIDATTHPNVVGVKQAVGALDLDTLTLLATSSATPSGENSDSVAVLAGDDAFIAPTIAMGGVGAIAAAAHLCTPTFVELTEAAGRGDRRLATSLAATLLGVVSAGYAEPSPAVWKGALHAFGEIASDAVRRPMTTATPSAVRALLAACGAVDAQSGPRRSTSTGGSP